MRGLFRNLCLAGLFSAFLSPAYLFSAFLRLRRKLCQFLIRESAEGGMQYCREGDVVQRIIRRGKETQDGPDLQRVEIPPALLRRRRNPFPHQDFHILFCPAGQGAEQDHDIPEGHGPLIPGLPVQDLKPGLRVHELPDPACDQSGLDLRPVFLSFVVCRGSEDQFRPVHAGLFRRREFCPGIERGVTVIADAARFRGHQLRKDRIAAVQDFAAAAEVFPEIHARIRPLRDRGAGNGVPDKTPVFFRKDPGPGLTEGINGLLHVSHKEQAAVLHGPDQLFLHLVGILVFVHIDLVKALPVLRGDGGGNAGPVLLFPEQ